MSGVVAPALDDALMAPLPQFAGDELAGELVQRVHSCYPHVPTDQALDPASVVQRRVTDWVFENGTHIRIVRRVYRDHLGSVFIYVR